MERPLVQLVLKDILYRYHFNPDDDDKHSSDDEALETEHPRGNTLYWRRRGDVWRVAFSLWCRTETLQDELADVALIEMEVRVDAERLWVTLELLEDPHGLHTSLKRISDWPIEDEAAWREFDTVHIGGALEEVDRVIEKVCNELSDEQTDFDEEEEGEV